MKLHVFPVSTRGLKVARRVASGLGKAGFSDAVVYAPKELKHGALKRLAGRVFNKEDFMLLVNLTWLKGFSEHIRFLSRRKSWN